MTHEISRRDFLKASVAAGAGGALAASYGSDALDFLVSASDLLSNPRQVSRRELLSRFLNPKKAEADAGQIIPDFLEKTPENTFEVMPGVRFGELTQELDTALRMKLTTYRSAGFTDHETVGIIKGAFYLQSPWGYYAIVVTERAAFNVADGTLYRMLAVSNTIDQKIQADSQREKWIELPQFSKDYLNSRSIAGDGDEAPSYNVIRKLLTISGAENYDQSQEGQYASKKLNKDGSVTGVDMNQVPWMKIAKYTNGHNIPEGTLNFMTKNGKANSSISTEIFGLPLSDPYWMYLNIGGEMKWVLWQAYERATVTFTPSNPKEHQFQVGLVCNPLTASLNEGNENPIIMKEVQWGEVNGIKWQFNKTPDSLYHAKSINTALLEQMIAKYAPGVTALEGKEYKKLKFNFLGSKDQFVVYDFTTPVGVIGDNNSPKWFMKLGTHYNPWTKTTELYFAIDEISSFSQNEKGRVNWGLSNKASSVIVYGLPLVPNERDGAMTPSMREDLVNFNGGYSGISNIQFIKS